MAAPTQIVKAKDKAKDLLKKILFFFKYIAPIYLALVLFNANANFLLLLFTKSLSTPGSCPVAYNSLGLNESSSAVVQFSGMVDLLVGAVYDKDERGFLKKYRNGILENQSFQAMRILMVILFVVMMGTSFVFGLVEVTVSDMFKKLITLSIFLWGTQSGTYEFYDTYLNPLVFDLTDDLTVFFSRAAGFVVEAPEFHAYLQARHHPFAIFDGILVIITSEAVLRKFSALVFTEGIWTILLVPAFYFILGFLWVYLIMFAIMVALAKMSIALSLALFPLFLPFILFDLGIRTKVFGVKEKFKSYFEVGIIQPCIYIVISVYVGSFVVALIVNAIYKMLWFPACYWVYFGPPSGLDFVPFLREFLTFYYWKPGFGVSHVAILWNFILIVVYVAAFYSSALGWSKTIADSLSVGFGSGSSGGFASQLHSSFMQGAANAANAAMFGMEERDPKTGQVRRGGGLVGLAQAHGGAPGRAFANFANNTKNKGFLDAVDNAANDFMQPNTKPGRVLTPSPPGSSPMPESQQDYHQNNRNAFFSSGFNRNHAANVGQTERTALDALNRAKNSAGEDKSKVGSNFRNELRRAGFGDSWIDKNADKMMNFQRRDGNMYEDLVKTYFAKGVRETSEVSRDTNGTKRAFTKARDDFVRDRMQSRDNYMNETQLSNYFESRRDEMMSSDIARYETSSRDSLQNESLQRAQQMREAEERARAENERIRAEIERQRNENGGPGPDGGGSTPPQDSSF